MNMLENAFYHLTHFPLVDVKHIELAMNAEYQPPKPEVTQRSHRDWTATATFFNDSKLCKDMAAEFGECHGLYVRSFPMTMYNWHADFGRNACINVLLVQPQGAITCYKTRFNRLIDNIKICDYELLRPTLFNTTLPHCVVNPTDQYRYILTITAAKTRFEELKDWLLQYKPESF